MEKRDIGFTNVFEGIQQTKDAIDAELSLLKEINVEQKKELKKAKRFNIIMLIIAVASFVLTVVGVVIGITL